MESAVFSPAGDRVLSASRDGTAILWDLDGTERAVLTGHDKAVVSARFSPEGDRMVTASEDGTARLWDLEGNELAVLRGHGNQVRTAAFSPDGRRVLTRSRDGTARLWLARCEDLLRLADRRVTRDFTAEERRRFGDLLGADRATAAAPSAAGSPEQLVSRYLDLREGSDERLFVVRSAIREAIRREAGPSGCFDLLRQAVGSDRESRVLRALEALGTVPRKRALPDDLEGAVRRLFAEGSDAVRAAALGLRHGFDEEAARVAAGLLSSEDGVVRRAAAAWLTNRERIPRALGGEWVAGDALRSGELATSLLRRLRYQDLARWPGDARAKVEEILSGLEWSDELPLDGSALNELAWELVDPERPVAGAERIGLELARLSVAAGARKEPNSLDTFACALAACGRIEEAIAAQREVLALTPGDAANRKIFEERLLELERRRSGK